MTASTLARTAAFRRRLGRTADDGRPRWVVPSLLVLLGGTALLYLWGLGASGYANDFYAAAVQAGTKSWKALLFGSVDAGNGITVDKPPAAMWVMGLSGRIFGFSSWSMLVPQALMGVAAVALLYGAVRRVAGYAAGLGAGAVFALTPVAVLMFRFNNPDALLVLLLVAAAYATVRAVERGSVWWLTLAGAALGFGFLTKMMQAFLILPALALVYLVAAPNGLLRRVVHLLVAGAAVVVSAGWFVALVELWPAASRPYIGGSTDNSLLQLALGYNGLGRVFGGEGNGGGGGPGGAGGNSMFGGDTGITRLFNSSFGTQASWLLPAALIALVAGLWLTRREPRTNRLRASLLLWGGWLLITGAVFSFMSGTIHPYYTVALAPAIGAVVGIGGCQLWAHRASVAARATLAGMIVATGVWGYVLLHRAPTWNPWLAYVVLAVALVGAVWLLIGGRPVGRVAVALATVLALVGVAAPAGYAWDTAATAHTGSIPVAGPGGSGMRGFGAGAAPSGNGAASRGGRPGAASTGGGAPGGASTGGGMPGGAVPGGATGGQAPTGGGMPGGSANAALAKLLAVTHSRWAAATTGSQSAASLELASGASVLGIGGFTGSDDYPTLSQFKAYVAAGQVRYFIAGGGGRGGSSQITSWVTSHYTATSVGGTSVYDLAAG